MCYKANIFLTVVYFYLKLKSCLFPVFNFWVCSRANKDEMIGRTYNQFSSCRLVLVESSAAKWDDEKTKETANLFSKMNHKHNNPVASLDYGHLKYLFYMFLTLLAKSACTQVLPQQSKLSVSQLQDKTTNQTFTFSPIWQHCLFRFICKSFSIVHNILKTNSLKVKIHITRDSNYYK